MRRVLTAFMVVATCLLPLAHSHARVPLPPAKPLVSNKKPNWNMQIGGRTVRVHAITPETPGPWPTVMLLHGASGLGDGYLIWPVARALAKRGIASAIVQYFDALPDRVGRKGSVQYFAKRESMLEDAVDQLLAHPNVRGPAIGIYGYSLGGFHGLALAGTDRRINAVVSLAGALPRHVSSDELDRAAPVLLLHGTSDRIVPYARAQETVAAWKRHGRSVRLLSLPKTGHVPRGRERERIIAASVDFLAQNMALQMARLP
jgi:dienelactone hydrolase